MNHATIPPPSVPQPSAQQSVAVSNGIDLGWSKWAWLLAGAVAPILFGTIGYYLFNDSISMDDGTETSASHGLMPFLGILGGIGSGTVGVLILAFLANAARPVGRQPGRVVWVYLGLGLSVVLGLALAQVG